MNNYERGLVKNLISGDITRKQFIAQYPVDLVKNKDYILEELNKAYDEQNAEDVEYLVYLSGFDGELQKQGKYFNIYCKLLDVSWHYQHENLVSLLQGIRDQKSIDCLYNAALKKFDYFDYDDTYSFARKCIHALADIGTPYAKEKLQLLANSDITIIKEKARKHLS
jgi:hypothetical protein